MISAERKGKGSSGNEECWWHEILGSENRGTNPINPSL